MQPSNQPRQETPGQPAFPGAGYPGYGPQPLPEQLVAPPYGSAASPYDAYAPVYDQLAAVPKTSGLAIASLVTGLVSWFIIPVIGCSCFPPRVTAPYWVDLPGRIAAM